MLKNDVLEQIYIINVHYSSVMQQNILNLSEKLEMKLTISEFFCWEDRLFCGLL